MLSHAGVNTKSFRSRSEIQMVWPLARNSRATCSLCGLSPSIAASSERDEASFALLPYAIRHSTLHHMSLESDSYTSRSDSDHLPWEKVDGPPTDVGICLSGGGLRAASFSFGALQALQARRGLLYGPSSAAHLAAVSGGSYIAASYAVGAWNWARSPEEYGDVPPLSEGSPEETHILSHGRYLLTAPFRFLGLIVLNVFALVTLFLWVGVLISTYAALRNWAKDFYGEAWPADALKEVDRYRYCSFSLRRCAVCS